MNSETLERLVHTVIASVFLQSFSSAARADALDNWTTNQVSTNTFGLEHVAYGKGRFVAGGAWSDYGALLSSEDGLTWTLRASGTSAPFQGLQGITSLVFNGAHFLATAGPFGYSIMDSADGIQWTRKAAPYFSSGSLTAVVSDPDVSDPRGLFYLVGYNTFSSPPNTNNLMFYFNGSWYPCVKNPPEARSVFDIAYGAGRYVAIASGGFGYTSTDVFNWDRQTIGGGNTISFIGGRFFVPLSAGTNLISANGLDWAAVPTGVNDVLGKISHMNGTFYARAGNYLATSSDGTNWTQHTATALPGNGSVAFNGRRYVNVHRVLRSILDYDSYIYTSDPIVALGTTGTPPAQLILSGLIGRTYRIEFTPQLPTAGTNTWQSLTNLTLLDSPQLVSDPESGSLTQRFYRAVLLP